MASRVALDHTSNDLQITVTKAYRHYLSLLKVIKIEKLEKVS